MKILTFKKNVAVALLFTAISSTALLACNAKPIQPPTLNAATDPDSNFGWLDGKCIAIKNQSLTPGLKLTIVKLTSPRKVVTGVIGNEKANSKNCNVIKFDRDIGEYNYYTIKSKGNISLGIGLIGKQNLSQHYTYDACATQEGTRFTVWQGKPYASKQIWTGYEYLGYEMQSTCKQRHSSAATQHTTPSYK